MWACGAQVAMQVSYWKVRQVLLIFVEPKQNFKQINTLFRLRQTDCREVTFTNQDTSAHLIARSYCSSTHEALGSVAAPLVSDEHHVKVKTQQKHSNPINARGKKEDEEPDYIHKSFQMHKWFNHGNALTMHRQYFCYKYCMNVAVMIMHDILAFLCTYFQFSKDPFEQEGQ